MMTTDSPPTGTDGQQATVEKKAPTCYNCGDSDHYFDACPEPARKIPVGLAAAQAARVNAGAQSHYGGSGGQDHRSKRQKTGSGPVVTKYPGPGPVVTKYGLPPAQQHLYGRPQGFNAIPPHQFTQGQYGSHPQQPFGSHNAYPQYGSQGPPVAQAYNQFGQHPPHPQMHGPMPPQGQAYGYAPHANGPYYGQPYGPQPPYGPTAHPQYPHQPPVPHPYQQQNMQHVGYGPPHQTGPYYSGPYPQGGPQAQPHAYHMPPQQPPAFVSYQPFQGPAPQGHSGNTGPYSQQSQQWAQSQGQMHGPPTQGGSSDFNDQSNVQSGRPPFGQDPSGLPNEMSQAGNPEGQMGTNPNDQDNPSQADEFDVAWEESAFDDSFPVSVVSISTPLGVRVEEEPIISNTDNIPIKTKYVRASNMEVFTLPIKKSLHWATLQKDPALAKIDKAYPSVPFDAWDEYCEERRKRKILEGRSYEDLSELQSYEMAQEEISTPYEAAESVGHHGSRHTAARQGSIGSRHSGSRSRSRTGTPAHSRHASPALGTEGGRWASESREVQLNSNPFVDPAEAVLASLGVTGSPKPISSHASTMSITTSSINVEGQRESIQQVSPKRQTRQDSGYASARPSIASQGSWGNGQTFALPPKRRSVYDGCIESPMSEGSLRSQGSAHDNGRAVEESPLSPTSAALLGEVPRATSEDRYRSKEPLRQDDDHYVKKKPQPKVAEAYSRRW